MVVTTGQDFDGLLCDFADRAEYDGLPAHSDITPELAERLAKASAANGVDLLGPPMAA